MIKQVSTGYSPRQYQEKIHRNLRRFNVLNLHRRFGKTHLSANEIIHQGLTCEKHNPQYAYLAPTFGMAKRVAWDIFKQYLKNIPGVSYNENDLKIEISRPHKGDKVKILLLGTDNLDGIRGLYLDGVVLDEYASMHPEVWSTVVRAALSDRKGWAIFISTPRGQNHFYRLYKMAEDLPDWFVVSYPASKTGVLDQGELDAARMVMSEEEYEQEFEVSFAAALVGAYYGKEIKKLEDKGHVTHVPYDRAIPVVTAWDLGMDDSTTIWFAQVAGRGDIRIIDYHEETGMDIAHYAKVLKEKGYNYKEHILPHDAKVRDLTSGKTRVQVLQGLSPGVRVRVLERTPVQDGINAVRVMLSKCWFDKQGCNLRWGKDELRGLESLKQYEKAWDSKNSVFQNVPKHNWASHGADAFRTLAMGLREDAGDEDSPKKFPRQAQSDFELF